MEKMKEFRAHFGPTIKKHGGKVPISNPHPEIREGSDRGLTMVVEFESLDEAWTFYASAEDTAARVIRMQAAKTDQLLVEGL